MALEKLIPVGKLAFAYELGIAQRNELISTVGASLNLEQYKERDVKLLSKLPIATLWDGEHFEDNVLRKAIEQELTNPQGLFELIEELCDYVTF